MIKKANGKNPLTSKKPPDPLKGEPYGLFPTND